jgi:hypothetical protein
MHPAEPTEDKKWQLKTSRQFSSKVPSRMFIRSHRMVRPIKHESRTSTGSTTTHERGPFREMVRNIRE